MHQIFLVRLWSNKIACWGKCENVRNILKKEFFEYQGTQDYYSHITKETY